MSYTLDLPNIASSLLDHRNNPLPDDAEVPFCVEEIRALLAHIAKLEDRVRTTALQLEIIAGSPFVMNDALRRIAATPSFRELYPIDVSGSTLLALIALARKAQKADKLLEAAKASLEPPTPVVTIKAGPGCFYSPTVASCWAPRDENREALRQAIQSYEDET